MKLKTLFSALIATLLTFGVWAQSNTTQLQQSALDVLSMMKSGQTEGYSFSDQQELYRFHTNIQSLVLNDFQQEAYALRTDANAYMKSQQSLDKFVAQLRLDEKRIAELSEADQVILMFKSAVRLKLHQQAQYPGNTSAQVKFAESVITKLTKALDLKI